MKIADLNNTLSALYLARKDKRIPRHSKILLSIAVGYALSPVDLIPDFIPFLGQLDDVIIVPALLSFALRSIPQDVLEEYKSKIEQMKMSKRFGMITIFIVLFWVFLAVWLVKIILKFL